MVLKYTKQKLAELKEEMNKSTIIMGDFNMFLSITERAITHRHLYEYGILGERDQRTWHNRHIWNIIPNVLIKIDHILNHKTSFRGLKLYRLCSLTILELSHKSITEIQLEKSLYVWKIGMPFRIIHSSKKSQWALAAVAQMVGASSRGPKGHGFSSRSGHIPR